MKAFAVLLSLVIVSVSLVLISGNLALAQTTSEKRELSQFHKDLSKITSIIRRKKYDEAEEMIDQVQDRLDKFNKNSGLGKNHKSIQAIQKTITLKRQSLERQKDPKAYKEKQNRVSFLRHVAPILNKHCVKCHSDDPQGKLHLDTFAEMKKGGTSGPLLTVGNANRSLIMARLMAPEKQRMPQKAPQLSRGEITILALWINQGAAFDGEDEDQELSEMLKPKVELPPLKFAKATGNEKVSFRNDIAPFMVKYCQRCHQGKEPGGQLYLTSYETLMRGGESGPPVVPGKPEQSRIYILMASFEESKRMPLEGKVTRKNFEDMKTWIAEGARYDAEDPRVTLRGLNPSDDEVMSSELATYTPEQFLEFRKNRTEAQWKKAIPDEEPHWLESEDLYYYGNVSEERLEKVQKWADEQIEVMRKLFSLQEGTLLWKGKLTIFVVDDREAYDQFNNEITGLRIPEEVVGNFNITESQDNAYIVLHDIGDKSEVESPALRVNLITQMTNAYLATSSAEYPEWFSLGIGLAIAASEAERKDLYLGELRASTISSLEELENAEDIFRDGTFFSAEQTLPVGFTLTEFLFKKGGQRKLSAFIQAMEQGGEVGNSIRVVYGVDLGPIANTYFSTLKVRRKRKP